METRSQARGFAGLPPTDLSEQRLWGTHRASSMLRDPHRLERQGRAGGFLGDLDVRNADSGAPPTARPADGCRLPPSAASAAGDGTWWAAMESGGSSRYRTR